MGLAVASGVLVQALSGTAAVALGLALLIVVAVATTASLRRRKANLTGTDIA